MWHLSLKSVLPSLSLSCLSHGEISPASCYPFMLIFNSWVLTQRQQGPNLLSLAGPCSFTSSEMIDAADSVFFFFFFWKVCPERIDWCECLTRPTLAEATKTLEGDWGKQPGSLLDSCGRWGASLPHRLQGSTFRFFCFAQINWGILKRVEKKKIRPLTLWRDIPLDCLCLCSLTFEWLTVSDLPLLPTK